VEVICGVKVAEGVWDGKRIGAEVFKSNENNGGCVGVDKDGWNGVGVGDELGADVIKMKGANDCWGVGVLAPQADTISVMIMKNNFFAIINCMSLQ
jgi:hypothetical protein